MAGLVVHSRHNTSRKAVAGPSLFGAYSSTPAPRPTLADEARETLAQATSRPAGNLRLLNRPQWMARLLQFVSRFGANNRLLKQLERLFGREGEFNNFEDFQTFLYENTSHNNMQRIHTQLFKLVEAIDNHNNVDAVISELEQAEQKSTASPRF